MAKSSFGSVFVLLCLCILLLSPNDVMRVVEGRSCWKVKTRLRGTCADRFCNQRCLRENANAISGECTVILAPGPNPPVKPPALCVCRLNCAKI